jgi:anti-sigma-K factor RskA
MPTASNTESRVQAGEPLPKWNDLSGEAASQQQQGREEENAWRDLATWRFALAVGALVAVGVLYVGHVHATQALLSEVERARTENRRLHLKASRLQSTYDEATAPSVIHRRAEKMGLEDGLGREGGAIYLGTADSSETSAAP